MVNKIEFQAPLISIGIPVFNGEQFISEAINSLLEQTEVRFEIIISDNCSTDGTHGICTKYAKIDSRIRLIRQKENLGAYANFIKVLSKLGVIILFGRLVTIYGAPTGWKSFYSFKVKVPQFHLDQLKIFVKTGYL